MPLAFPADVDGGRNQVRGPRAVAPLVQIELTPVRPWVFVVGPGSGQLRAQEFRGGVVAVHRLLRPLTTSCAGPETGKRVDADKLPKIFYVNWFRSGDDKKVPVAGL